MSERRLQRLRASLQRRQPDLTVLLDGVHKPHNLAAVLRSCDAVGVFEAHAVWPWGEVGVSRHASAGAGQWVPVTAHESMEAGIANRRAAGMNVYVAHESDAAIDFRCIDYTQPTAIVLGAELTGPSDASIEQADGHLAIPMQGLAESLNVSVAAAVILFEAQRQRAAAGLYDDCRLSDEVFQRTLFEWMQPRIARYCRRYDLPYPPLEDDGEVTYLPRHG